MIPKFSGRFHNFLHVTWPIRRTTTTNDTDDDDDNSENETKPVEKKIHFLILMRTILIMSLFTTHNDSLQFRMFSLFPFRLKIKKEPIFKAERKMEFSQTICFAVVHHCTQTHSKLPFI